MGTAAVRFLDDTEVKVTAEVVHEYAGFAHTRPGCSVALATNDRLDHKPEPGKGTASCEGKDSMTTVNGSRAVFVSEVVEKSVVDGADVKATNTYMTKFSDEESAAVVVKEIGKAAIAEEYLATGGSGGVARERSLEKVFAFAKCTGANDAPGELGFVIVSSEKHGSDVEGTHK